MKLRQFISIMGIVALVALIYSPSTIGFSASGGDGGTGPNDASGSGTSAFFSFLKGTGYHVTVANDSQQLIGDLGGTHKLVYLLIGPDVALSSPEVQAVKAGYQTGRISSLVAEGNKTNPALLQAFGAQATGNPIIDPASSFQDRRVFTVELSLGPTKETGLIDVASPLLLNSSSTLHAVASTSPLSFDSVNAEPGPRTVVAAGSSSSGARAVVLTDSAPFTNFLFNNTQPQGTFDEKGFVAAMVAWVAPSKNVSIILDDSHYAGPQAPKFQVGLSIGPLVTYALEQNLAGLNTYYAGFPSQVSGFLGGYGIHVSDGVARALVALVLLLSVYGAITRWFAHEKKGRDDQPHPSVERTIVAESRARTDFLQTSRSKGVYVATLAQLYDVLDSVVFGEFGKGLSSIEEGELASKVGAEDARRAKELFLSLSRLHEYASGNKRFLFPPVLRWRALTTRLTGDAESFLNKLGMTIAGEEEEEGEKERVDVLMRERVRA